MNAPVLTRDDMLAMLSRALACCPDLEDDEAVMRHVHLLGLCVSSVGATAFDAILDEARAQRRETVHG